MVLLIGLVVVGILALAVMAWWSSGRATARMGVDRPAARADAEAVARSERIGLHPGSPGAGL